ncbi:hypothetical protein ACFXJ8_15150 [Nonomuraea sp. NPDC059194]|uniref:hypothetical protein n=1 Tax=Nonomuraea sp. NPDC059194 TaxID=3346764 RepID=UPI0036933EB5
MGIHDDVAALSSGLGWLLDYLHERIRDDVDPRPWDGVKLIHCGDIQNWERFPRCQETPGITYLEYRLGAKRLKKRRKAVADLLAAQERLQKIDSDEVVTYRTEWLTIPPSLFRRRARIPLPHEALPGTEIGGGTIVDGVLEIRAGWREKNVQVTYTGPSRVVHAEEIARLTEQLASADEERLSILHEVNTSRFSHPVLFISHRWETIDDPDPTGGQLNRLKELRDCFFIYDYSSFPQLPRTAEEEAEFHRILQSMDELIRNVVILDGPGYLTRGWCVYEYLVASLNMTTVCDEVQDPAFVALRDWSSTPTPLALQFRDGFESAQQNYKNRKILTCVNNILPIYRDAEFQTEHDHQAVTGLLIKHLQTTLPSKKLYESYLGEWQHKSWTDEEITAAFDGRLAIPNLNELATARFRTNVPDTIVAAAGQRYQIKKTDWVTQLNPWTSFLNHLAGRAEHDQA